MGLDQAAAAVLKKDPAAAARPVQENLAGVRAAWSEVLSSHLFTTNLNLNNI